MTTPNRQSGQVRISSEIESRGRTAEVPTSGMAQAVSGFASEFNQVGAKIGALADHAAAVEGTEAGKIAGLDPEFRPTKSLTIRGEAYDRAGLQVAETRTRQSMLSDLDAAYDKHGSDPSALAAALSEKRRTWLSNVAPEMRADLEVSFDGAALSLNRQAARAHLTRLAAEQKGALTLELGEGLKRLSQQAYASGLDAEADKAVAGGIETLTRALSRTDTTGKLIVEPATAAKIIMDAKTEVATARINGAFSRLPSLGTKAEFIAKLRDDFGKGEGIAAEYDAAGFERVISSLESDYRSARAADGVSVRAIAQDVAGTVKVLEKGFDPGDDAIAALKGRIAAVAGAEGAADLSNDLAQAENMLAFQKAARTETPAALEAWVAQERAALEGGQADPHRVQRLTSGEALLTTMRTELKQDPIGWADRVGLIKVEPLDFSNAETAGTTMKTRIAQADEIAQTYGQEPVYLRPDEKRALSAAAAQGGEQMLSIASAISSSAGERTPKVIAEIAEQAPVVAFIAGHVNLAGMTPAARDAADGVALIKTEGFKALAPSKDKSRQAAAQVLRNVLSDMPRDEEAVIAAANAAYEIRARRQGLFSFDESVWQQGLRELIGEREMGGDVYGGIVTQSWMGAHPLLLPPSVKQDTWREVLDMVDAGDLDRAEIGRPVGETGKALPLSALRSGTLVTVGPGQYAVATGDPDTPGAERWIKVQGGDPLILDMHALAPILSKRRPDLFLGGG